MTIISLFACIIIIIIILVQIIDSVYNNIPVDTPKYIRIAKRPSGYVKWGLAPNPYRNSASMGVSLELNQKLSLHNLYFVKLNLINSPISPGSLGGLSTICPTNLLIGTSKFDTLFGSAVKVIKPSMNTNCNFPCTAQKFSFTFIANDTSKYLTIMPDLDTTVWADFLLGNSSLYPARSLGIRNVSVCKGDSLKISASVIGNSYDWSTDDTIQSIYAKDSGWYISYINMTDSVLVDSIHLIYNGSTTYNTLIDTFICKASAITLQSSQISAGNTYFWNTTDTTPTINIADTVKYWVKTVIPSSCSVIDSFSVQYFQHQFAHPPQVIDTLACFGSSVFIGIPTEPNTRYLWNTGDTLAIVAKKDSGIYIRQSIYNTCNIIQPDSFKIHLEIPPNLTIHNADSFCIGTIKILNATSSNYNKYKWNTGDTISAISITNSGKYSVTASDGICAVSDTVNINSYFSSFNLLPNDTSFCKGSSCILNVSNQKYTSYLWSTTEKTPSITIRAIGKYSVIVSDSAGCLMGDTVNVTTFNPPPLQLVTDTFICNGTNLLLDAKDSVYTTYQWNTGANTSKINITQPGIYSVTAGNGICTTSDTVNIKVNSLPQLHLTQDTVVCFDDIGKVVLDAGKFKSYYWYPTGQTTETIYATVAEQYVVVVTDTNNCVNKDTTLVEEKCGSTLYVPNAFTPNGDGINDIFLVHSRSLDQFEMRIYNRWGEQIFYSNTINNGWDGTFSNTICPEGVYTWTIKYEVKGTSNSQTAYGSVTLLR